MLDQLQSLREQGGPLSMLTAAELSVLASDVVEDRFATGEIVVRADAPIDRVYVVLEGRLAAQTVSESIPAKNREIGPGELLGVSAIVAGGYYQEEVRAIDQTRLCSFPLTVFDDLLDKHPKTWKRISGYVLTAMRRTQLSIHMNAVFGPFGILERAIMEDLKEGLELVTLEGGETLFRQGGLPEAVYILTSGRLRVVVEGEDGAERMLYEVGSGETVGELSLFTDTPQSATVYAVRNSQLVRVSREDFFRLIEIHPSSMMKLSRIIVDRLKLPDAAGRAQRSPLITIALVPTRPSASVTELARGLADALSVYGSATLLESAGVDASLGRPGIAQASDTEPAYLRLTQWLNNREETFRYVVYQADPTWTQWTERCASQADQVIFVADAKDEPDPGEVEDRLSAHWRHRRAPHRSLVLLHDADCEPSGTQQWLVAREVDDHYHLRLGSSQDYARFARYLTGNAVALVLGGGGARGFAHIGVIRALGELGIPIDLIGGASIGASIAGFYTLSYDWEEVRRTASRAFHALLDYTFPAVSLLKGSRALASASAAYGNRQIEDLWIPYFAVSTNLTRAEQVIHRRGSLLEAVQASIAIPGVFPPVFHRGDYLVDGGLLNNVPMDVMRKIGATGPLIVVDVAPASEREADPRIGFGVSGWGLLANRLNPWSEKVRGPSILSLLMQSTVVGSVSNRNRMKYLADLYLELQLGEWGMLDFEDVDTIADRGYELSHEPVKTWQNSWLKARQRKPCGE